MNLSFPSRPLVKFGSERPPGAYPPIDDPEQRRKIMDGVLNQPPSDEVAPPPATRKPDLPIGIRPPIDQRNPAIFEGAVALFEARAAEAKTTFAQREVAGKKLAADLKTATNLNVSAQTFETSPDITLWVPTILGNPLTPVVNPDVLKVREATIQLGAEEKNGGKLFYRNPEAGPDAPAFEVCIRAIGKVKANDE